MTKPQADMSGEDLWQRYVAAEHEYFRATMALFQAKRALLDADADIADLLGRALKHPPEWGPALDLLLDVDESVRRQIFPLLIDVASCAHGHLQKARNVILSMESTWVLEHVPAEVDRVLLQHATYDEYRRLAELLAQLDSPYLAWLVERAAASEDADIREVGEDFQMK